MHRLREFRVRAPNHRSGVVLVSLERRVLVARGEDGDFLSRLEIDVRAVAEHGGADLGALRVEQCRRRASRFSENLAVPVENLLVRFMRTVREVETRDAHTGVEESLERLLVPALRSHSADDLRLADHGLILTNHGETDVRASLNVNDAWDERRDDRLRLVFGQPLRRVAGRS